MNEFLARNPKQLDLCLRLVYAEHIQFYVKVRESAKKKIEYVVAVEADEHKINELREKYRILIS